MGCLDADQTKSPASKEKEDSPFFIGWSQVDITPKLPAAIGGMRSIRIVNEALDPLTATVLLLYAPYEKDPRPVVLISCDLRNISDSLLLKVREKIAQTAPEIDPQRVVMNATHTHNAPPLNNFGLPVAASDDESYNEAITPILADAVVEAWRNKKPGGVSFGLTHAVIGHNRIMAFFSGESRKEGKINDENFSHVEGFEDSSVHVICTWSHDGELTGLVVNVAVPSQVSQNHPYITADYWHDVRVVLRERFGDKLYLLPQCAPAGDQMSAPQINRNAEQRMESLTGRNRRQQIADRLSGAIESILPAMRAHIDWHPVLRHQSEMVALTRRVISEKDVEMTKKTAEESEELYKNALAELESNPELINNEDFLKKASRAFYNVRRNFLVKERFAIQKTEKPYLAEMHAIRLGDTAIATNPFELYLDFGVQIRARSIPVQVFLVQLAGPGSYVPTERSVRGGAYGAVPSSTNIGPEGGRDLVTWTVNSINAFWPQN